MSDFWLVGVSISTIPSRNLLQIMSSVTVELQVIRREHSSTIANIKHDIHQERRQETMPIIKYLLTLSVFFLSYRLADFCDENFEEGILEAL